MSEELRQARHEEVPRDRALHLDSQCAFGNGAAERAFGIFDVVENGETTPVIGLAIEGRHDGARRALEQPHTKALLHLLDHLGCGGARNIQVMGRLRKASAVNHPRK